MRAVMDRVSTSTTRSRCSRSNEITDEKAPRSGSTPPTTLVPPPNGTTATPSPAHSSRTEATSSAVLGNTTASGAVVQSPERWRKRSG